MLVRRSIGRLRTAGFTLIELVIAMAIVAILIVAGLPGITEWIQNAQIRAAAEGILNGLQTARSEAIRRNTVVTFTLDAPGDKGGTGWTIVELNSGDVIQTKPSGEGSRNAVVSPVPAAATTVTFNGFGRLPTNGLNADGSALITTVNVDSTVLDAAVSRNMRIVISGGGELRMCDPNVFDTLDPRKC